MASRPCEHRAAKDRTPFLPPCSVRARNPGLEGSQLPHSGAQPSVQPPAATEETSQQLPPRKAAGRRALQLRGALLFVGRRAAQFGQSPSALSLVTSQSGAGELSLLGDQRIYDGSYLQTKSSVKENTRKYYCSPGLFLRVYDTQLSTVMVYIPQVYGHTYPHTRTHIPHVAHLGKRAQEVVSSVAGHSQWWDLCRQSRGSP